MSGATASQSLVVVAAERGVAVDGDGRLWPADHGGVAVMKAELFAVLVLWDVEHPRWRGWLTTTSHRSVCFSQVDLDAPAFRCWLGELPGWDPGKLSMATQSPGLHLVWRLGANAAEAASQTTATAREVQRDGSIPVFQRNLALREQSLLLRIVLQHAQDELQAALRELGHRTPGHRAHGSCGQIPL